MSKFLELVRTDKVEKVALTRRRFGHRQARRAPDLAERAQ